MSYRHDLKHPKWQRRRLEIMARDEWMCQTCKDKESQLLVHHLEYRPRLKPWQYGDADLVTLCEACHRKAHDGRPLAWPLSVWARWLDRLRSARQIEGAAA